jgi:translation initiation factor 2 beta subunit (eIF-2beta)/eIF-5
VKLDDLIRELAAIRGTVQADAEAVVEYGIRELHVTGVERQDGRVVRIVCVTEERRQEVEQ